MIDKQNINIFKSICSSCGNFEEAQNYSYLYDILFYVSNQYFTIRAINVYSLSDRKLYEVICLYYDSGLKCSDGIYINNFFEERFQGFLTLLFTQIPVNMQNFKMHIK